jgi:hypothetical protein
MLDLSAPNATKRNIMTNPAPYYVEKKTITVIDGKRIDSYSPNFVRVIDIAKYGEDAEANSMTSIVRPVSDFVGNAEIDAYTVESDRAIRAYMLKVAEARRNAKNGLPAPK